MATVYSGLTKNEIVFPVKVFTNIFINSTDLKVCVSVDPLTMCKSARVPLSSRTFSLKMSTCPVPGILAFTSPMVSEGLTSRELMSIPSGVLMVILMNPLDLSISLSVESFFMGKLARVFMFSRTISLKISSCWSKGIRSLAWIWTFMFPIVSEPLTLRAMVLPVAVFTNIPVKQ
ncbi:hypothetical protein Hanom_Chr01g00083011 [Helianthus anomalus]